MRQPCLKRRTRCLVILEDGRCYEATNTCDVEDECARAIKGCATGEGYELCGSRHAESNSADLVPVGNEVPGTAYLYGHDWACGPCQWALTAVGVRTFVLTGEPA